MKNVKKYPKKQLEKYSGVFVQLSLVFVLFLVYQMLEFETLYQKTSIFIPEQTDEYLYEIDKDPVNFVKEKIAIPKVFVPISVILDVIDIKKNDDLPEQLLPDIEPSENPIISIQTALNNYIEIKDPVGDENVPFILIEDAPIYRGCEGLTKEKNKKCFIKSIQKFVISKFNSDLAQDLGLNSGNYKMHAQFVIDKEGNITNVLIKAPHHRLEKEVGKIIHQLPQFTPGMQRKIPVNVKFTLPISFRVE